MQLSFAKLCERVFQNDPHVMVVRCGGSGGLGTWMRVDRSVSSLFLYLALCEFASDDLRISLHNIDAMISQ